MKILNLVYPEKSEVKYKISNMPDGQQQVTITNIDNATIEIRSRLNNFKDLELIICAVKSLNNLGIRNISLFSPYFLGARSDRKFEKGGNNYLKDVICPIINSLNLSCVTVIDPHSEVLEACLNNYQKKDNSGLFKWVIEDSCIDLSKSILVSPDAGANKKIYSLAKEIDFKGEILTCSKSRDKDGNLTKTNVPWLLGEDNSDLIIVDDICDGGRTFINLMVEARKAGYIGKAYLVVTHGIFSAGFEELNKYFDGIYTTNSYSDITNDKLKQMNVW